jgi:gamma-glutamyl-gamma-aminobutyrate hydrolase PuuD
MKKQKMNIGLLAYSLGERTYQNHSYQAFCRKIARKFDKELVLTFITVDSDLEKTFEDIDLLVLPGGADVDPRRYGQKPAPECGRIDVHLEYLDSVIQENWVLKGKPTIGICRGMQSLNVMFGGTLYQHVTGHDQSLDDSSRSEKTQFVNYYNPEDENCQEIVTNEGVKSIQNVIRIDKVNTFHHQAVDKLADNLKAVCWTRKKDACPTIQSENNIIDEFLVNDRETKNLKRIKTNLLIEGFVHKEFPIIGVQWHPEEFNCEITEFMIESQFNKIFKTSKVKS